MSWLLVVVSLLALIFIHELGHFLAAKSVGIRATKFYVGFKPALYKKQLGDTEYGIGAIPLGGYVNLVGMLRPGKGDAWWVADAAKEAKPRRDEAAEEGRGAGVDRLTPLAVAIETTLEDGDLDDLPRLTAQARAVLDADRELLHERTHRDAVRSLDRIEEALDPRAYWRAATWRRIVTIAAGPVTNAIAALLVLMVFYGVTGIPEVAQSTAVESLVAGKPAAQSGMRVGDRIVRIGATPISEAKQIKPAIAASGGEPIAITVVRGGATVVLPAVAPYVDTTAPAGSQYKVGLTTGIERVGTVRYSFGGSVRESLTTMRDVTTGTFSALANVIHSSGRKQLSSVVGIVDQSEPTVRQGTFLGTVALISLALAIFNLLPFLPLDGGHIAIALIERVRGRAVSRVVLERVSVAGIMLVLVLFAIGLTNDIGRIGGGP